MKILFWIVGILVVLIGSFYAFNSYIYNQKQGDTTSMETETTITNPQIIPIMHATAVIEWDNMKILTDPTDAKLLDGRPYADIVLVTDIHGDHYSSSTLSQVVGPSTSLVVPQAVKDLLPTELATQAIVVKSGQTVTEKGFQITGVPMYNIPESDKAFHTKGRGNGYVIERDSKRVYVAGDTSATPEMKALTGIDIALVPMNLPYTMSVEEAAQGVLAFKPKTVYPYHYRGQDGLSDVNKFKSLVNAGDPNINVVLADWYPSQQ